MGKQLAEICAISAYSFVVSWLLLMVMKYIPGLHLRVSEEAEELGLDMDQLFDEQIGDWSYLDETERLRNRTIVGQVGRVPSASSTERVPEESKEAAGDGTKAS